MAKREFFDKYACCAQCKRSKSFPKYSCKTCANAYTNNFVLDKLYDHRYQSRLERKSNLEKSDERLRTLYARIKNMYFDGNYVPDPRIVIFRWKKESVWGSGGGWCHKTRKEIRIGKMYQKSFVDASWQKSLVCLMIHEMVHLRMAHHRRTFKNKVEQIQGKVQDMHLPDLFKGLMTKGGDVGESKVQEM